MEPSKSPRPAEMPTLDNSPGHRYVLAEEREIGGLVPTIWPFKVEWMEFVGEDRLPEWEEIMRTKVGLPDGGRMAAKPGCATVSGSGDGWDDSDYWGNGC
jgi:hypothetical protein